LGLSWWKVIEYWSWDNVPVLCGTQLLCSLSSCDFLNTGPDIDGAYFGTTFPHLFLMTYPQVKPAKPTQSYVPRIFGFKLHKSAR
jgi:hypothetical protein